jgi:hypothetical protein
VDFLPVPHALGIRGITEVISVLRFGQPSALHGVLPGFAALRFEAIALTLRSTGVGKKELLAV